MEENNQDDKIKFNFSNIRTVSDIRLILELVELDISIEKEKLKKFDKKMIKLAYQRKILEK